MPSDQMASDQMVPDQKASDEKVRHTQTKHNRKDNSMKKMDDLTLLHLFYQSSHLIHIGEKFPGQGRLLILLLERGTLTQRELIDITGRRSATLSEQLDGMDKAGLIVRTRNLQDRRNIDISLTASGRQAAAEALDNRNRRAQAMFSSLSQEEKEQLGGLLEKMLPAWKAWNCSFAESEGLQK